MEQNTLRLTTRPVLPNRRCKQPTSPTHFTAITEGGVSEEEVLSSLFLGLSSPNCTGLRWC